MRAISDVRQRDVVAFSLLLTVPDSNEALFARLTVLAGTPYVDTNSFALGAEALASGTMGLARGHAVPDPLVLAAALRYAAKTGDVAATEVILSELARIVRPNGSFGFADEPEDIALTAEIVRALSEAPASLGAGALASGARAWLLGKAAAERTGLPSADLALLLLAVGDLDPVLVQALVHDLQAKQEPDGSFDGGDIRSTALAIQALSRGLPDLTISRPAIDLAEAITGETLVRTVLVSNHGLTASPPSSVDYRLEGPGGAVLLSRQALVPGIGPSQTVSVLLDLGPQGSPGPRTIVAMVNPLLAFAEADYDNNALTYSSAVADLPDLIVEAVDLSVSPHPPMLHESNRITVRVRNVGEATARNVHVQVFLGEPGAGGILAGETVLNAVSASTPRTFTTNFIPRTKELVHLVARLDPADTVRERNEANNSATLDVTPVNPSEFTVDLRPYLYASAASVAQGEPVSVTYYVSGRVDRYGHTYPWNGLWPFKSVAVALHDGIPGALGVEVYRQRVTPFAICNRSGCAGVNTNANQVSLPRNLSAGLHRFTVVIDPENEIDDVDRLNNTASVDIEIQNPGVPELYVSSIGADRRAVAQGRPATLRAVVQNGGEAVAVDVPISITLPTRVISSTIPMITPGETHEVVQHVAYEDLTPSAFDVTLRIDPDSVIAESTKTNNSASVQMYQGAGDLKIDSVVQLVDPAAAGAPTPVEILVRNDSTVRCHAWWTVVRNQGGGILGSVYSEEPLEAGQSRSMRVEVSTVGLVGPQALEAQANCPGVTDASQLFFLRLGNPDFMVTGPGIVLSPEHAAAGQPVVATVLVSNTGDVGASTSVRIYRGYPEQGDLVSSGTVLVAAGGTAAFTGVPFVGPHEAPYVITAVLDEENAHTELDEWNNTATRSTLKAPGEVVVAFDEVHGSMSTIADNPDANVGGITGGLFDFARDLVARGYGVVALNPDVERLTPAQIRGVDVLLAFAPTVAYTSGELTLLREFVENGGGFFYLGDHRRPDPTVVYSWAAPGDQLGSTFGFTCNSDFVFVGGGVECSGVFQNFYKSSGEVRDHVITAGVFAVASQYVGSFGTLPPAAEVLVRSGPGWSPPNAVVSAAFPVGQGRMAIHGDSNILDADFTGPNSCGQAALYYAGANARFGLQVVDWLARGALGDWKPDLTFNPSRLVVSSATVNEGELVQVSATVRNVGGSLGTAGETIVRLYDGTPAEGKVIGEQAVPALDIDQGYEVAFRWDTALAAGVHGLTAVVDPDGRVDEFDEQNNVVAVRVEVRRALDLRVDPSDIMVTPGDPASVAVRVHNVGYVAVPAGTRLSLFRADAEGEGFVAERLVPEIGPRQGMTVTLTWPGAFPNARLDLVARVAPPAGRTDADPTTNEARREVSPPTLSVHTPLPGTRWGGRKSVRLSASSLTRPNLTCSVAMGPAGGDLTGLPGTTCDRVEVDTTQYPDGQYMLRVTADDGLQHAVREVAVEVSNSTPAVRLFGSASGTSDVTLATGASSTTVRIPAGSRVSSATAVIVPVPAAMTTISPTPVYDTAGAQIVRHRGAIHVFYTKNTGGLWTRVSYDEGATWTEAVEVGTPGATIQSKAADGNSSGIHLVYCDGLAYFYRRSADGETWSSPVRLATSVGGSMQLRATEEGLTLIVLGDGLRLAVAAADGQDWGTLTRFVNWPAGSPSAVISRGALHLLHGDYYGGYLYRRVSPERYTDERAYSWPVQVIRSQEYFLGTVVTRDEILAVGSVYPTSLTMQRCDLDRDCTNPDEWLPEPPVVSPYKGLVWLDEQESGQFELVYPGGGGLIASYGVAGGAAWSDPVALPGSYSASELALFIERDAILGTGRSPGLEFYRSPRLTPANVGLDVGSDGNPELSTDGLLGAAVQTLDLAPALNAYLAIHADADDGVADGFMAVPFSVVSSGAGQLQLADLEVAYVTSSTVAAYAEPPVFSPTASPGVLDTSALSVLGSGPIAIMDAVGTPRRTLAASDIGGRSVGIFDGRDDAGNPLPSGRYPFGPAGSSAAEVEIDDIPPIVALRAGAEGSYGGLAAIHGVASDADWAGTARNFARYTLEYTTDGSAWHTIATSTSSVDGVLGNWDTRRLAAGPATLRLTARDRAGNSASTSRTVGVSSQAPIAPVIDAPTVAGRPLDSLASSVTVAGVAEAGTTVTVFVNGLAAGSAPSDGRWSVPGVILPEGISSITAGAARDGLAGPRSQAITVARYALTVALDLPERAPSDAAVTGTATLARASVTGGAVTVRLSARDSVGAPANVGLTPTEQVVPLSPVGTASFSVQLGGNARAGTYTILAEVVAGGLLPARAERSITLDPFQLVTATLTSDRATYGPLQFVGLESRLTNGGSAYTGVLSVTITVTTPLGQDIVMGPYATASMPPGGSRSIGALFGSPPALVGTYVATTLVLDEWVNVVATAQTSFQVRQDAGPSALSGTLLVNPTTYYVGSVLEADWTVTNGGADGPFDISVLLMRPDGGLEFWRHEDHVVLASGATMAARTALSTATADGNEIVAILLGDGRGLAAQSVAAEPPRDTTPPVITISGFQDGEYRSGAVTPVVTIADESSFTSEVTLNEQAFTSGTTVLADGEYTVAAHAVDSWLNAADAARRFTIDTVSPLITVTGVEDGEFAPHVVSPVVTVSDPNLDTTEALLDAVAFVPGTEVGEGNHSMDVTARDRAGNQSVEHVEFTVDLTPPVIAVDGVVDGGLTNLTVFLTVQVSDANPGWDTVRLDGMEWDGLPVSTEGDHLLEAEAHDLAGNVAQAVVHFTIDKTPPAIVVEGVASGGLYAAAVQPAISLTETHPAAPPWTATLNGASWTGSPVLSEGEWSLTVSAADAAGNAATPVQVAFAIDLSPPRISVAGVTDGLLTRGVVVPTVVIEEPHPGTSDVRLDGAPFVSGTAVTADGTHVLTASATDALGHAATPVRIAFTRDSTAPEITITGVSDGGAYYMDAMPGFTVSDVHPGTAVATIDGAPFDAGTPVSAPGWHTFEVTATDLAGNTSTRSASFQVVAVQASVTASIDSAPRVLIVVNCAGQGAHCGQTGNCADSEAQVLKAALEEAAIPYEIALDGATFLQKLRENEHNVRIVYRSSSSATNRYWELRELTFEGGGLVLVNDGAPDNDPKLREATGVSNNGMIKTVGSVSIAGGDLGPARTLSVSGSGIRQKLVSPSATAVGTAAKGTVVSTHRYGLGRAVTLTLNPEQNDAPAMRDLLVQAVRFAAGGAPVAGVPGAPQYVRFESALISPAGPLDFRLDAWTSAGLVPLSDTGTPTTPPRTWTFPLTVGAPLTRTLAVSSGQQGTYSVLGELGIATPGVPPRLVASAHVDVTIAGSIAELRLAAIAATQAIPAGLGGCAKPSALEHLTAVDPAPATEAECDVSITRTLQATDDLKLISGTEATDARKKADQLLRALQVLYPTLP